MFVLGIQGNFGKNHDASAALLHDNQIVAAAEEERFTRYKHAIGLMPDRAIEFCLKEAGITMKDVDYIAFPRTTWESSKERLHAYLWYNFGCVPPIKYIDHHTAHAASAYYISGFKKSLVITFDQSGDGLSCCAFKADGLKLKKSEADVLVLHDYIVTKKQ